MTDSTTLGTEKIVFGLYGAGGYAREVMPLLIETIPAFMQGKPDLQHEIYFIETAPKETEVNDYPVVSEKEFFEIKCGTRYFNVAIANSKIREKLARACIAKGAKPMTIRSSNTIAYDKNTIDEGAILCAYSMITSNAKIGKFFHSNIYSYVAHDCIIGDYVTFAPNVHCNGNVHIGNHAYIGTSAVLRNGTNSKPLVIGEGAIVGMGAVVTKDVPANATVVGNPARVLRKT